MISLNLNPIIKNKVLFGLIFLYIFPGLFGRSPWTPDDALGFAQAYHFLNTPISAWSNTIILGQPFTEDGLLSAWIAALFGLVGQQFGFSHQYLDDWMRLSNLVWLALILWSIWHTTYRLALRPELQPQNPFGNAPTRTDYARSVANASVLCLLGTLGLLLRSHFQVSELAELAGLSIMLMAAVRSFDQPSSAGWYLGLGAIIAFFSRGWSHLIIVFVFLALANLTHPTLRFYIQKRIIRASSLSILAIVLWIFWVFNQPNGEPWLAEWHTWNITRFTVFHPEHTINLQTLGILLKTTTWFFWPILPLSIWTVWSYKKALGEPSLRIPVFSACGGFCILLLTNPSEEANYFPLIAPLSVLAAIGLSTMRRGLVGLIDWFALLCFSFLAILVWLGWSAATFSWPNKIANNLEKLSPGYQPAAIGLELFIALIASAAWLILVIWRTQRPNSSHRMLWRPMILSCGGVTLVWCLLMTLWLPRIDYAKSYNPVAQQLANHLNNTQQCISYYQVDLADISLLSYHSQLNFQKGTPETQACNYLLIEDSLKTNLQKKQAILNHSHNRWQAIWTGHRNSDRHERFILFQRIALAQ